MPTTIHRTEDPALEVAFVHVNEETPTELYAPLYRFVWPN